MNKETTVEVDKDRLTDYIIKNCTSLCLTVEGTRWCREKMNKSCRVPLYERDKCPRDCPHMNEFVELACDGAKCPKVKKTIKNLKA